MNNATNIVTKVRNASSAIHSATGSSPLKLVLGKQEWDEYCEWARKEWHVTPRSWATNWISGIRIIYNPDIPRGIYTEDGARAAQVYIAEKEGE